MSDVKTIEIHENIFADNDMAAKMVREKLKENNCYMVNFMSSPGSGKTTTLISLINRLKNNLNIYLMNVDIKTDCDASKIAKNTGINTLQINNGGLCHIDAEMTLNALKEVDLKDIDLLILENIGNLVCPAEFDTGANKNIMILSVPEGDDKPLKYPLMFSVCDLVLINKIDVLPFFDFDMDKAVKNIKNLNKNAKIIPISAKTGEGIDEVINWLNNCFKF